MCDFIYKWIETLFHFCYAVMLLERRRSPPWHARFDKNVSQIIAQQHCDELSELIERHPVGIQNYEKDDAFVLKRPFIPSTRQYVCLCAVKYATTIRTYTRAALTPTSEVASFGLMIWNRHRLFTENLIHFLCLAAEKQSTSHVQWKHFKSIIGNSLETVHRRLRSTMHTEYSIFIETIRTVRQN